MPVRLSETPTFYQPVGPVAQLEADLEMFSDPAQCDQGDPRLQMIVQDLRSKLDGKPMPEDSERDQLMGVLRSLTSSEEEAQELAQPAPGP